VPVGGHGRSFSGAVAHGQFLKTERTAHDAFQQAQAAAMIAAANHGVSVHEYPPRQVKEAVTGHGSAEKSAVKQALMARLGLAKLEAPVDAADALAVAFCHHLMTPINETLEIR